jgi:GNAT superfamily N-acetyltransferase
VRREGGAHAEPALVRTPVRRRRPHARREGRAGGERGRQRRATIRASRAGLVAERLSAFASSAADAVFVAGGPSGAPLLGVASAHALPLFHAPGQLVRLTALAVRPEAQGAGTGRALVAAAEEWAWSVDARRIEVRPAATSDPVPTRSTRRSATRWTSADS